jgi:selenocysteine lyase/cysteine desulfurase
MNNLVQDPPGIRQQPLDRRRFLARTGALAGAIALGSTPSLRESWAAAQATAADGWDAVRSQFELRDDRLHFAAPVLAAHPTVVRDAIASHRRSLDSDPKVYLYQREAQLENEVLETAGRYLDAPADEIALTDSTTMGLGTFYGGLALTADDEVLTTRHDFYSTHRSLRYMAQRTGARVRRISLYDEQSPQTASRARIIESITSAVSRRTKVVALTWVHSSSGVKLPISEIASALRDSAARAGHRIYLFVDGVHGFGAEDETIPSLGCDALITGCHKWLFGPRGTGLVWAARDAWRLTTPTIPSFDGRAYVAWLEGRGPSDVPLGRLMTPGGFHSFEHRWALTEAFGFHQDIGRAAIAARTRTLATQLKEGLAALDGVEVVTPMDPDLSSGIVCFTMPSLPPEFVVETLERELRIVASVTPYRQTFVRFMPSIVNSADEIEEALLAIRVLNGQ